MDDLKIALVSTEEKGFVTKREFFLSPIESESLGRMIEHYHFSGWPDF
jgi:hypothetical protein